VKLINTFGEQVPSSPWLRLGVEYEVYAVEVGVKGKTHFRLQSEDGLGLFDIVQFEIVDQRMSPTWVFSKWEKGGFVLGPQPWSEIGFWENFYDGIPEAIEMVKAEIKKMSLGS
jgi:hypothetical protein